MKSKDNKLDIDILCGYTYKHLDCGKIIIKLEDQVCSLELSKKLKELGVKQECCAKWAINHDGSGVVVDHDIFLSRLTKICSAFTASELLELMNYDENLCNKLAKILIHLIENKLIEVK